MGACNIAQEFEIAFQMAGEGTFQASFDAANLADMHWN